MAVMNVSPNFEEVVRFAKLNGQKKRSEQLMVCELVRGEVDSESSSHCHLFPPFLQ